MPSRIIPATAVLVALCCSGAALAGPRDGPAPGPLPRWREGGTPPVDPAQALQPRAVTVPAPVQAPGSGTIVSPPEYSPSHGALFRYSTTAWATVVTDCVAALTGDPAHDEIAYVIVASAAQKTAAEQQFAAAGADLDKVEFLFMPTDSIWLRDYGPHFIWQDGAHAIADSHYYPTRPLDNFIPTNLGDSRFGMPTYDMGLYYSGGNFQPDAAGNGYITSLIHQDNPGFGDAYIGELYGTYQGIGTVHIFPRLPASVDATGHIDMWLYLVDENTVIISEFLPGENATAIQITNDAAAYMETLGYEVHRVPDQNAYHPGDPNCHYTYTNAFRVNDRIFIPSYGQGNPAFLGYDADAAAVWAAAAPDAQIIPIDSYPIIYAAGAVHCIVMQVPHHIPAVPSAHVVGPDGGELLVTGNDIQLAWTASDDVAVTGVDLYYSTDGGATFPNVIALGEFDDGQFTWTVPDAASTQVLIRSVAHDGDGNSGEATSAGALAITGAQQAVYDFSSGAGVDKWAWGYQTLAWTSLDGVRRPADASIEISALDALAYQKISASDAAGGDTDTNRYIAPTPTSGRESTHILEFTIAQDPAAIMDIGLLWEGYGDACLQMELYVWDEVQGDWCDGQGQSGENRYVDNFAGNVDAEIHGHLQGDVSRYINGDGILTMLLYAERSGQESFHDYASVTVIYATLGDLNGDGVVSVVDLLQLLGAWGPCQGCPEDLDGDGMVGVTDFLALLGLWG